MEAQSECVRVAYDVFARLGADLDARSVLGNEKSLRRSSVGSLLRVRCWLGVGGEGVEQVCPYSKLVTFPDVFMMLFCWVGVT